MRRERSFPDRRQVLCHATAAGRRLLDRLDPLVNASHEEPIASLSGTEVDQFIRLLDRVRKANAGRGAARTSTSAV